MTVQRGSARGVRWLLWASRAAFALTFLLAMATPTWEQGTFSRLPLVQFRVSGQRFQLGALSLLPVLSAGCWVLARLLERPRRPWRWGPAHIALPLFGFGTLTLVRVWPVHIAHTAAIVVVAIALFWGAYLYLLQDWPERWLIASMAALLSVQGAIGILQFIQQGSLGLDWFGELSLDPQGQAISVIEASGRRWLRAYGLTAHPNVLGGYLGISGLVCLGAVLDLPARSRRWLWAALALGGIGLFVTFSRAAWLGALLGTVYLVLVTRLWERVHWRAPRTRRALWIGGVLSAVLIAALLSVYGDLLVTRFFRLGSPLERMSIDDRVMDMRQAWSLIRDVPLKGAGSGYYLAALWAGVGEDRPPGIRKVHNVPLLAAAELGVFGAVLWLWLTLAPAIALARRSRAGGSLASAGCGAGFVAALVISMLDSYLYVPSTWWAALCLGVLAGAYARGMSGARRPEEGG
jgi:hypothetical protein